MAYGADSNKATSIALIASLTSTHLKTADTRSHKVRVQAHQQTCAFSSKRFVKMSEGETSPSVGIEGRAIIEVDAH